MSDCERCKHHGHCIIEKKIQIRDADCKAFELPGAALGNKSVESNFDFPVKVALTFADGKIITYRRG